MYGAEHDRLPYSLIGTQVDAYPAAYQTLYEAKPIIGGAAWGDIRAKFDAEVARTGLSIYETGLRYISRINLLHGLCK